MGPGDNSNPGVYFLIGSGTPGMYMRSGVYLDLALKQSYMVCRIALDMLNIPIKFQAWSSVWEYSYGLHKHVRSVVLLYFAHIMVKNIISQYTLMSQ